MDRLNVHLRTGFCEIYVLATSEHQLSQKDNRIARSRWISSSDFSIETMIRSHGQSLHTVKISNMPIEQRHKMLALCERGNLFDFSYSFQGRCVGELHKHSELTKHSIKDFWNLVRSSREAFGPGHTFATRQFPPHFHADLKELHGPLEWLKKRGREEEVAKKCSLRISANQPIQAPTT